MTELPLIEFENLFRCDRTGQKYWNYLLGPTTFEKFQSRFLDVGAAAAEATAFSRLADRSPPELIQYNELGERIDRIGYHPAYAELKKRSYGKGLVSLKYDANFLKEFRIQRHQIGFALASYFAQTETGLFCPLCMTDALGRVLEKYGTTPEAQTALTHIASADLTQLWEGAMFMTEKQGGSDVGANLVRAEFETGQWRLHGEKWFCSNADAQVILALARMPGDDGALDKGTRGLGLFLVMRETPPNNRATWTTNRLKDKLGVRSMASGEITFQGTRAQLIAGAGAGFKIMTEMVNMSRIYNAVASLGIVRRSLMEAAAFGQKRLAFKFPLTELPLWRASLADLSAEHLGLLVLVFEATRQLDASDNSDKASGDNVSGALLRLTTPIAKGFGGKLAVFAASEAMELIGGNAYIEDHILPRLLRDAQVLPIWEGTTHIQSLDLLRAMEKEGTEPLIHRCSMALAHAIIAPALKARLESHITKLKTEFAKRPSLSASDKQRQSRELLEVAGRTLQLCLLAESTRSKDLKPIAEAAIARLFERPSLTAGLASHHASALIATEPVLLDAIF